MSEKLKTLCDLLKGMPLMGEDFIGLADGYELRQEAIKWIKELKKADNLTLSNSLPDTDENSIIFKNTDKMALILWIKHFFNIEESDLK